MKICTRCKIVKSIDEFTKRSASKDGLMYFCKECNTEKCKEYNQQNLDKVKKCKKEWQQNNVLRVAFNGARLRAKKKNLPFDITLEWLENRYTGRCELTNIEFRRADEGTSPYSPSLDRIDSSKGYTKDNVRIICWSLNRALGEDGIEVYKQISKAFWREQEKQVI